MHNLQENKQDGSHLVPSTRGHQGRKQPHDVLNQSMLVDSLKQLGFYTDCLGNRNWSVPSEVVDRNLAETLVNTARIVARGVGAAVSAEEIELFVGYVGPVRNHSLDSMKAAIAEMHRECVRRGLRTGDEDAMHRFVWRQQSQEADE